MAWSRHLGRSTTVTECAAPCSASCAHCQTRMRAAPPHCSACQLWKNDAQGRSILHVYALHLLRFPSREADIHGICSTANPDDARWKVMTHLVLRGSQRMCHALIGIDERAGKVVCGIHLGRHGCTQASMP
eukprot:1137380-Pelagomonas_calceolata.AAC.7